MTRISILSGHKKVVNITGGHKVGSTVHVIQDAAVKTRKAITLYQPDGGSSDSLHDFSQLSRVWKLFALPSHPP